MLLPVIMCGGAGSRLWPVSRKAHPKPFIRLGDGQSFLQKAWIRGALQTGVSEVLTVTNNELLFKSANEFEAVQKAAPKVANSFILEPFGRNTAAAVATAALYAEQRHGRDTLLLVLAADHLVSNSDAFGQAVAAATELARQGRLVTFGITPEAPETGYGYIEADGTDVRRFVEKPDLDTARQYLAAGNYLWNSGMFCFSAGTVLDEMQRHCPEVLDAARRCLAVSAGMEGEGAAQIELDSASFAQVPDISIDYALMEKSERVSVVRCDIGWSDIGSWRALGDLTAPDAQGNRVDTREDARVIAHNAENCHVYSEDRIVALVGVRNLTVVDTPDALLIVDRDHTQDVKQVYTTLQREDDDAHKLHRTVYRPWGTYTVLEEGPRFKIKRIVVKPGASLSLQMHHHRSEHWIVVSGMAHVNNGETELFVRPNESTYIPAGNRHRVNNPGVVDLVMIEVQSGDYLGEDDIVRFQDVYGRA